MGLTENQYDELMNIYYAIHHPNLSSGVFVYFPTLIKFFSICGPEHKPVVFESIFQLLNSEYRIYREELNQSTEKVNSNPVTLGDHREEYARDEHIGQILNWLSNHAEELAEQLPSEYSHFYQTYANHFSLYPTIKITLDSIYRLIKTET